MSVVSAVRATPPAPERRRGVSPLPDLLEDLPDLFAAEVLARQDPTDRAVLAQVEWPWMAAVVVFPNLLRAGKNAGVSLVRTSPFCMNLHLRVHL